VFDRTAASADRAHAITTVAFTPAAEMQQGRLQPRELVGRLVRAAARTRGGGGGGSWIDPCIALRGGGGRGSRGDGVGVHFRRRFSTPATNAYMNAAAAAADRNC
jgi:hypothetical protein